MSTSKLHMSPDDASLVLGIDNRAIRAPCESFSSWCKVQTLSLMKWLFGPLDALEASFGCGTLRWHAEVRVWCGSNACHTWSRGRRSDFFARDAIGFAHSFKPTRVLAVDSLCHTDAAKAHKLSSPLHDASLTEGDLCLSHTCVKHKPPHPEFSKRMKGRVWVRDRFEEQVRVGGTQNIDGFLTAFRRRVGRRPFNTVGNSDEKGPRMEDVMRLQVRFSSFKKWLGGRDMFAVFGQPRKSTQAV